MNDVRSPFGPSNMLPKMLPFPQPSKTVLLANCIESYAQSLQHFHPIKLSTKRLPEGLKATLAQAIPKFKQFLDAYPVTAGFDNASPSLSAGKGGLPPLEKVSDLVGKKSSKHCSHNLQKPSTFLYQTTYSIAFGPSLPRRLRVYSPFDKGAPLWLVLACGLPFDGLNIVACCGSRASSRQDPTTFSHTRQHSQRNITKSFPFLQKKKFHSPFLRLFFYTGIHDTSYPQDTSLNLRRDEASRVANNYRQTLQNIQREASKYTSFFAPSDPLTTAIATCVNDFDHFFTNFQALQEPVASLDFGMMNNQTNMNSSIFDEPLDDGKAPFPHLSFSLLCDHLNTTKTQSQPILALD